MDVVGVVYGLTVIVSPIDDAIVRVPNESTVVISPRNVVRLRQELTGGIAGVISRAISQIILTDDFLRRNFPIERRIGETKEERMQRLRLENLFELLRSQSISPQEYIRRSTQALGIIEREQSKRQDSDPPPQGRKIVL